MKIPEISVVMPVYNAEIYLKESMESILSQTFENFELIIVDDGSTDKSVDTIKAYNDLRIRLIRRKHDYIYSLNAGMSAAKGKYIARMDADDRMRPERLLVQYNFMEENPDIDICGSWMQTFGENQEQQRIVKYPPTHDAVLRQILFGNVMGHPSVMMRQKLLSHFEKEGEIYNVYDKEYIYAEDYNCWIYLIKKGCIFSNIPACLMDYRISENQVTQKKYSAMRECTNRIQREYLEFLIDFIMNENPVYYNLIENSINLFNDQNLSSLELRQIIYVLFSRIIKDKDTQQVKPEAV
ncbi:MAG: glycosyltransferase [Bacteroidales bacterium]|nr:glycosyltransferase [Bacteroidales bacterium]